MAEINIEYTGRGKRRSLSPARDEEIIDARAASRHATTTSATTATSALVARAGVRIRDLQPCEKIIKIIDAYGGHCSTSSPLRMPGYTPRYTPRSTAPFARSTHLSPCVFYAGR